MTHGSKGAINDVQGPYGLEYYRNLEQWNGEDRPSRPSLFPRVMSKRVVYDRKLVRVEGHATYVDIPRTVSNKEAWTDDSRAKAYEKDAPHNYTRSWDIMNHGTIALGFLLDGLYDHGTGWMTVGTAGALPPGYDNPFSASDEYKLIERLQVRVQGSDFNAASCIGAEGLDTLRLIGDVTRRIYRTYTSLRKGNVKRALDILRQPGRRKFTGSEVLNRQQRDIYNNIMSSKDRQTFPGMTADKWLEVHLGIAPLLGDVKAAAEQLAHRLELPVKRKYTASLTRKAPDASRGIINYLVAPYQYGWQWAGRLRTVKKSIVYLVEEDKDPQTLPQLLGLNNPEIVLWNALPLSFVADWFLPVGSWLEARGFASGLRGQFVISTKDSFNSGSGSYANSPVSFYKGFISGGKMGYTSQGAFARTVYPSLDVNPPKFRPLSRALSWSHAATGAALVQQMRTGRIDPKYT